MSGQAWEGKIVVSLQTATDVANYVLTHPGCVIADIMAEFELSAEQAEAALLTAKLVIQDMEQERERASRKGGPRPGAGRPATYVRGFSLPRDTMRELREWAEREGLSVETAARELVIAAIIRGMTRPETPAPRE